MSVLNSIKKNSYKYNPPSLQLKKNPSILILSGGGIKGLAYIGVLRALEKLNLLKNFKTFVGTSIGALICALLVIGYDQLELEKFSVNFNFDKVTKLNFINFLETYGLDDGEYLEIVIRTLIKKKLNYDKITLGELYAKTNKTFIAVATCLNDGKTHYLHHQSHPEMPLYVAIRISMCLPLFYVPIKYNNRYYADGGCTSNFAIDLFKHCIDDVLGFYIGNKTYINDFKNFPTYLYCLMDIITGNGRRTYEMYKHRSIYLHIDNVSATDFEISLKKKKELFHIGFNSCMSSIIFDV